MIDITVAGPSANSYVDTLYADLFVMSSVGAAANWPSDDTAKQSALMDATRLLDASFDWFGSIATDAQALDWPRSDVFDKNGRPVASDTIPAAIKSATCRLALNLLISGGVQGPSDTAKQVQVGAIRLTLDTDKSTGLIDGMLVSLLADLGEPRGNKSGVSSVRVIRS